jgi:hypothetical protein
MSPIPCRGSRSETGCLPSLGSGRNLSENAVVDVLKERQRVCRARHDEALDPLGKASIGVGVLRERQRAQVCPYVGGIDKGVLDGRSGDGKDRPGRRGDLQTCAALDLQMIRRGVKDGGRYRIACDIMCPRDSGCRSNGQGVREKSQFLRFPWTHHQQLRPERDLVPVSVGRGVNGF